MCNQLKDNLLKQANELSDELTQIRRAIHQNAEVGFDLNKTVKYVKQQLNDMGIEATDCGKCGISAIIGGKKSGKTIMLRADMDALPMTEETDLPYSCESGAMHACGHDMHTTMLLGTAKLLKRHEDELEGTVKLMFQPAEEIFSGANSMIEAGILQSPKVDTAVMIHVMAGLPIPEGTAIVCAPGVSAPSADIFTIEVSGKGCHGSMPNEGIDPITASAHILIALQEIQSRELALSDNAVLTIGSFIGGNAPNVIPDKATLRGSIRTFDEQVRKHIKERLTEIASGIATTFRCTATVTFDNSCPTLYNDEKMSADTYKYAKELLGSNALSVAQMQNAGGSKSAGSEDFAHISQLVPSIMIALSAGQPKNGYKYPQHHPKVMFNESVLPTGSALLAYIATRWLFDNKSDNK